MLKVNEIFYSLQGEGLRAGRASIFLRLAGCNLRCKFCDTKYAWQTGIDMTEEEIAKKLCKFPCSNIVITGGEPLTQDIDNLIFLLDDLGYNIYLETNGTKKLGRLGNCLRGITVSPKPPKYNIKIEEKDISEIKLVVDKKFSFSNVVKILNSKVPVFLQPEDNKKENIKRCVDVILKHPNLRLSLQLHKLIGIK